MITDRFHDRNININGSTYIYFGGTSYLGITTHPKIQLALIKNIKKWGASYGSSRLANVQLSIYNKFEEFFAKQVSYEASLVTSSGTIAGRLVIDTLSRSISSFYHYPKTHPAVTSKNSMPLFINEKLHPKLLDSISEEVVISLDAILSLEVKPTSFGFLNEISTQKKVTLLIDESNSIGIVGKNGCGISSTVQHANIYRKIMVSSLGKALGMPCGIIAADIEFINIIKDETIFISSSAANPAFLSTYLQTQDIYIKQRENLKLNLNYLFKALSLSNQFKYEKNYPVIYFKNERILKALIEKKIIITSFNYPTSSNIMNRIVITANHTKNDLEKLILIINR